MDRLEQALMAVNSFVDHAKQSDVLKNLLNLIEEMRQKRRGEWREMPHPSHKRFTQEEIRFGPCPTYHNLLSRRSQRIPSRQMILDIAHYLECSIEETNEMLRVAQYVPEFIVMSDRDQQQIVARVQMLASLIPLPSAIVGKFGEVIQANSVITALNNQPAPHLWRSDERDIAQGYFNPSLNAVYRVSPSSWELNARGAVETIYLLSRPYLREKDFLSKLEQWKKLPDFSSFWTDITTCLPSEDKVHCENLTHTTLLDSPIRDQNIVIPFMPNFEVTLVIGVPRDEAALYVYRELGCGIDNIPGLSLG